MSQAFAGRKSRNQVYCGLLPQDIFDYWSAILDESNDRFVMPMGPVDLVVGIPNPSHYVMRADSNASTSASSSSRARGSRD